MNREELHRFISASRENESNICQICVIRGEDVVYEDCWRGFKNEDAVNVNSGDIIYVNKEKNLAVGMTGTFKPRIFDRVEFIEKKVIPVV